MLEQSHLEGQIISALPKLSNTTISSWSSDYCSILSSFSVKQSSSDHTISTTGESGVSSHGVGEGSDTCDVNHVIHSIVH